MKNFALIGASGYIAKRHMQAILETKNNLLLACDLNDSVGIIDSYFPNAEFFTEFENFQEYAQNLNSKKDKGLDFISVCSPNYLHFSHISSGLRLGCDVICEKPLVENLNQLEKLKDLEIETGKKVYNILQLRHHETIDDLKKKINKSKNKKHDVELTYITSRGSWYFKSWKNDPHKGFGILANIGIHFFDMLQYIFGKNLNSILHYYSNDTASGILEFEKANVKWFLSVNSKFLPSNLSKTQRTFRSIKISGKTLEFSNGFTDLHTVSYENILKNKGFSLNEVEPSIKIVSKIKNQDIEKNNLKNAHPLFKSAIP